MQTEERENAWDLVTTGLCLAQDWFRRWQTFVPTYSRENQRKPNQSGTNVKTHQKIKPNYLTEALREPQTPHKSFICCDEGLTVEKSA